MSERPTDSFNAIVSGGEEQSFTYPIQETQVNAPQELVTGVETGVRLFVPAARIRRNPPEGSLKGEDQSEDILNVKSVLVKNVKKERTELGDCTNASREEIKRFGSNTAAKALNKRKPTWDGKPGTQAKRRLTI